MALRRSAAWILIVLVSTYLGVGALWVTLNLGDVPQYGDTREYLKLARSLEVDSYRGIVYPALLRATDHLHGEPSILTPPRRWDSERGRVLGRGLLGVQVFQAVISLLCLAYFVHVLVDLGFLRRRFGHNGPLVGAALLIGLLVLDPLVSHFNLSIMTDGLALSASLAFCAALTDFYVRRSPSWLSGSILLAAHMLASGLRAEKNLVLIGTMASTMVLWSLAQRRRGEPSVFRGTRPLVAIGLVCLGAFATVAIQRSVYRDQARWPIRSWVLHQRVIFGNLGEVWDELPERSRSMLTPEQVQRFDEHIIYGRVIIDQATSGDAELRERLISDLSSTVLRSRWSPIVLDILKDFSENVLATFSFYFRLGVLALGGHDTFERVFHSDGTEWTCSRLAHHHPTSSKIYLALASVVFLVAALLAVKQLLRRMRTERNRSRPDVILPWIPVLTFTVANSFAFAIVADLVHIRYSLFSHAALSVLVYQGAFRWLAAQPPCGRIAERC
jgi:hypothetical protein